MHDQMDTSGISHHDPVVISLAFNFHDDMQSKSYFRYYKRLVEDNLVADLTTLPWSDIYQLTEPDDQIRLFNALVLLLFDKHVPLREIKTNRPFYARNKLLYHVLYRKDKVHKRWRRFGKPEDLKLLQDHYSVQFSPSLNSKTLWRNIKELG